MYLQSRQALPIDNCLQVRLAIKGLKPLPRITKCLQCLANSFADRPFEYKYDCAILRRRLNPLLPCIKVRLDQDAVECITSNHCALCDSCFHKRHVGNSVTSDDRLMFIQATHPSRRESHIEIQGGRGQRTSGSRIWIGFPREGEEPAELEQAKYP